MAPTLRSRCRVAASTSDMTVHVALADDHPIVLDGLEGLFRLEPDFQVVARCINGEETLVAVRRHRPDILILDLDRKSTRLNSSHLVISYAVFCLKKKKKCIIGPGLRRSEDSRTRVHRRS